MKKIKTKGKIAIKKRKIASKLSPRKSKSVFGYYNGN